MFERGGEGRKRRGRKWEGRRGRGGGGERIGKREKRGVRRREQKEGEGDRGGGGRKRENGWKGGWRDGRGEAVEE